MITGEAANPGTRLIRYERGLATPEARGNSATLPRRMRENIGDPEQKRRL